ncbi:MAG: hypothetical protein P1U57_00685 [Oleibacter sp.]|nr:hypothetical protein [Thalassolituus sp.]
MTEDWSGYKYQILRELGENVDMILGIRQLDSGAMRWGLHSHQQDDGVGAFTAVLDNMGISLPEGPVREPTPAPNWWMRMTLLREHLRNGKALTYPWREYHTGQMAPASGFVFCFLSTEQTAAIRRHVRRLKVGESAFFLSVLNRVCRGQLLDGDCERLWMLPHDFRRALGSKNLRGNFTAPLNLPVGNNDSANDIYGHMKQLYRRNILWGSWTYTNFARYLHRKVIERAYRRMPKPSWFGVYANMGSWKSVDAVPLGFVTAPPSSALCPVTAGSLTWNGQISFSLQLHSTLTSNVTDAEKLLAAWLQQVLVECQADTSANIESISMTELVSVATRPGES